MNVTYNRVVAPERVFVNGSRVVLLCLICEKPVLEHDPVILPWGSDYDGDYICYECVHKHFDPVIAKLLAEKKPDESVS